MQHRYVARPPELFGTEEIAPRKRGPARGCLLFSLTFQQQVWWFRCGETKNEVPEDYAYACALLR